MHTVDILICIYNLLSRLLFDLKFGGSCVNIPGKYYRGDLVNLDRNKNPSMGLALQDFFQVHVNN